MRKQIVIIFSVWNLECRRDSIVVFALLADDSFPENHSSMLWPKARSHGLQSWPQLSVQSLKTHCHCVFHLWFGWVSGHRGTFLPCVWLRFLRKHKSTGPELLSDIWKQKYIIFGIRKLDRDWDHTGGFYPVWLRFPPKSRSIGHYTQTTSSWTTKPAPICCHKIEDN